MAFIELRRPCRRRHVRCSGGSRFYYDLWIIVHIMNERIFLKLFSFHSEAEIISDCLRNGFWFLVCFWFSGFARVKTSWCPLLSSSKVWKLNVLFSQPNSFILFKYYQLQYNRWSPKMIPSISTQYYWILNNIEHAVKEVLRSRRKNQVLFSKGRYYFNNICYIQ